MVCRTCCQIENRIIILAAEMKWNFTLENRLYLKIERQNLFGQFGWAGIYFVHRQPQAHGIEYLEDRPKFRVPAAA